MPTGFFEGLKTAATSSYAFVAYVCLIVAWVYVAVAQHRLKIISQLPPEHRPKALEHEYKVLPRAGLSAEQWIRSRKHTLLFLAFVALLVVTLVLATVALTQHKEAMKAPKSVNWQMSLELTGLDFAKRSGLKMDVVGTHSCESSNAATSQPVTLPRDAVLDVTGGVHLLIDNLFRTHQNLIYPIGLSTTWDHSVHTVFDGRDVQAYREGVKDTFERDFLVQVTLRTPANPGLQYILIMSGATLNPQQIFAAAVDEQESAQSIWASPFTNFSGRQCGGIIQHPFVHPDGSVEDATWPIIAVPVLIQ